MKTMTRTLARILVPAIAVGAVGTVVAVDQHQAQDAQAAVQAFNDQASVFQDPAVIALAQETAYVTVARDRAPTVTATMTDHQVTGIAKAVCAEITRGVHSPDLSIRSGEWGSDALALETSALVNAANVAYCPDADLTYPGDAIDAEVVQ